jgi:hypothetical protein
MEMSRGCIDAWESGVTEGRLPALSELPDATDRWWSSRTFRVLFFTVAAVVAGLVAVALVGALQHDRGPITLMLAVYGSLFLAWLAFAGYIFDLSLRVWKLLLRMPTILAACGLQLLAPVAFVLLQPAWFVRRPRVGAAGRTYREYGFASRSPLAARCPWLTRLPAAAHVVTGRIMLFGPQAADPVETVRWPFYLSRYDRRPGLFPRRRDVDLIGHGGSALPQILVALMARGVPDDPDVLLLLARAPRDVRAPRALDGGDPAGVHPAVITAKERDFVCDELLSAGYCDQMIVGRMQDCAELIGYAWQQWRHHPVLSEAAAGEQVA